MSIVQVGRACLGHTHSGVGQIYRNYANESASRQQFSILQQSLVAIEQQQPLAVLNAASSAYFCSCRGGSHVLGWGQIGHSSAPLGGPP